MAFLTRTNPTRNIDRLVDTTPTPFGEWTVLREWGRRGSPGTVRLSHLRAPRRRANSRAAHHLAPAAARLSVVDLKIKQATRPAITP